MGSLLGTGQGTPMATQAQRANGVQVQSSSFGKGLPIVYGRARVPGNVIWTGDFQAVAHKQQVGKGGGGNDSTTYTYSSSFQLALCEGPVTKLGTIWKGSGTLSLSDINGTFKAGAAGQTPWSHLSGSPVTSDALSYPYVAWVACLNIKLGSSPNIPNLTFEVYGMLPFNAGTIDDAEPSAIVTDLMTSQTHGIDFSYLGSLTQFKDYCTANGIFISPVISEEKTMISLLKDLLTITNSTAYWSGGSLTVLPWSDQAKTGNGVTYTPDTTSVRDLGPADFMPGDGDAPVTIERKPLGDLYNCIRVEYIDRANNYRTSVAEAKDQSDIDARGVRSLETIQAHAITNGALAMQVAQRILQRNLYIRNTFSFRTSFENFDLEPGDVVTLTEPSVGLTNEPVRIISTKEGDKGTIEFTAQEFPAGVSEGANQALEAAAATALDTNAAPDTTAAPAIFRAPQFLTETQQPELWLGVSGVGKNWGGANVWISLDGTSYHFAGTVRPGCRYGQTTSALASGSDPDTANSFSVQLDGQGGELNGGSQTDADQNQTLMLVDEELISYETTTLVATNQYTLGNGYLRRGQYGTTIASHASGAPWLRIDDNFFRWAFDPGLIGSTVYIKFTAFNLFSSGEEQLANVNATTYTLGQGAEIPDTPATPTGLTVTGATNGNKLSWTNANPAAVAMSSVEYATASSGPWTVLGQTQGEALDHNFSGNTTYYYRVRARSPKFMWSAYSSAVSATGGSIDHASDGAFSKIQTAYTKGNRPYIYRGPYNSSTTYHQGDEVSSGGNMYLYISPTSSSGNAPPNPTYWQIRGPQTLDYLLDGDPTTGYLRMPGANMDGNRRGLVDFSQTGHLNKNADNIAETATNLHWKGSQQTALFSQRGGENHVTDPFFTSEDFWNGGGSGLNGYSLPGSGQLQCPVAAASANIQIQNRDGRGNVVYVPVHDGDTVRLSFDIVTAATGTAGGAIFGHIVKADKTTGVYYLDPGDFSAVGTDYHATYTIPAGSGAAWIILSARTHGYASGGTGPVIENPVLRIGSQTINQPNGAKGYINFGDNTTGGHIGKHGGNIPTSSTVATTLDHAFTKGSPSDANTMDSVPDGSIKFGAIHNPTTQGTIKTNADKAGLGLDSSGNVQLDIPPTHVKYTGGATLDSLKPAVAGSTKNLVPGSYAAQNLFPDPGATNAAFYSNSAWTLDGSGGVVSPTLAANIGTTTFALDGTGAYVKYQGPEIYAGQSVTLTGTIKAVTGTGIGTVGMQCLDASGAVVTGGYVTLGNYFASGTHTRTTVLPAGTVSITPYLSAHGGASGGSATISNFAIRIGSQTVGDPGGMKADDVQVGAGKAVAESGAEPTTGKSLTVLIDRNMGNISDDATSGRYGAIHDSTTQGTIKSNADKAGLGLSSSGAVKLDIPPAHVKYTGGSTLDSLKPAESGSDVTGSHTAADTAKVNGVAAPTVQGNAQTGKDLSTASSGAQLGDARQVRGVTSSNVQYYLTGFSSSANTNSSGVATVSVASGTLLMGGSGTGNVSYNSSSINNLAASTTYYLYYIDPGFAGGSQTLHATTTKSNLTNTDPNVVYLGYITTPAAGGTGGGSLGGCVSVYAHLDTADGSDVLAGDAAQGLVLNTRDDAGAISTAPIKNVPYEVAEPCVRISTANGSLTLSDMTPINCKIGPLPAYDVLGEEVWTSANGGGWETITGVQYVMPGTVMRISLGGLSYGAGDQPGYYIYTHNTQKP